MKFSLQLSEIKPLLDLILPQKRLLAEFIVSLVISSTISLCFPLALQEIYNLPSTASSPQEMFYTVAKWSSLFMFGASVSYFRRYSISVLADVVTKQMRASYFQELLQKKLEVIEQQSTGSLTQQLGQDISQIAETVTTEFSSGLRGFTFFIGGLAFLLYTSLRLTLLALLPLVLISIVSAYYGLLIKKHRETLANLVRGANSLTQEKLSQIKTVKLFNAEASELNSYNRTQEGIYKSALEISHLTSVHISMMECLGQNAVIWVIGYGAYIVSLDNGMDVGTLTAFAMYSGYMGMGFRLLASGFTEFKKASAVYNQIQLTMNNKSDREEVLLQPYEVKNSNQGPQIRFEKVSFMYPQREVRVVEDIDLTIKPGQVCGIVGQSGSGKTTLLNLLAKLYPVTKGSVLVDQTNINTKPAWWVRKMISIVSQDPLLFSGTIIENIMYGNPNADTAQVEEVCKRANAYDFIMKLPKKLYTEVGENGCALSGGQRQRVAIARALLKTPQILLLDEATSGLDQSSESLIQEVFESEIKRSGHTVILVTHKVKNLEKLADIIAVVQHGKLEAVGTYQELLSNPHFKTLL